jgi:hypothetical protein
LRAREQIAISARSHAVVEASMFPAVVKATPVIYTGS